MRTDILKKIYQCSAFSLKGDLDQFSPVLKEDHISCLILTARDHKFLEQLLTDLTGQTLAQDHFEVIVLDNSIQGLVFLRDKFKDHLPLTIIRDASPEGRLADLRNKLLKEAQGEFVLTLDDDTRLFQNDFLAKALDLFKKEDPDVVMPRGLGLSLGTSVDYHFLDPYSFATRCCLYKRSALESLGGHRGYLVAYDDIELGIRLCLWGATIVKTNELEYKHPPLFFDSLKKPLAIGQSIFMLQKYYPWYMWLLIYLNALRFLPLGFVPTVRNRQWFKISWGVLIAPFSTKKYSYHS